MSGDTRRGIDRDPRRDTYSQAPWETQPRGDTYSQAPRETQHGQPEGYFTSQSLRRYVRNLTPTQGDAPGSAYQLPLINCLGI